MDETRPNLVVIVGPTAAGKSDLALHIARRFQGEIVSVDSAQVYRGLDAATGKPKPPAREEIRHHLIDVADPRRDFSAGDFARLAERAIKEIRRAGKRPILAGGTGLYLRALLSGLADLPRRDAALRSALHRWSERRGEGSLHRMLAALDPAAASALPRRDAQRIVRAIEVVFTSGRPISRLIAARPFAAERFASMKIGFTARKELLAERIERRVEEFFDAGLVEEARGLLAAGVPATANCFKALGYREVLAHLRGEIDFAGTVALVKRNTRRYAKRQLTWFRREPGIVWFEFRERPEERFAEIGEAIALRMEAPGESRDGHR